jgi:hypothetical protein
MPYADRLRPLAATMDAVQRGAPWLPADFIHPTQVDLASGHHMRHLAERDVDIDYPAVMSSQPRLWSIFGAAWGWPEPTMSYEHDQADLARHERESNAHLSFAYAVLDAAETELLGCVYVDPPARIGADADICWWVVDKAVGSPLDTCLAGAVPQWITTSWPFTAPRVLGRDLSWDEGLTLPTV